MSIHPTAVIHPDAEIGEGTVVGPYAVIEGAARIGQACTIQAHAIIGARVTMGSHNFIGYGAVLGADPQDTSFNPETPSDLRIGNNNRIREYCTLHRGTTAGSATIVGDDCFLMGGVHLAHDVELGSHVIIANNALLGGHVKVADRVFIGGGCVFHQHVRVGRLAICQGTSGFSKNVPPFSLAAERNSVAGLNVVGLRRAGLGPETRAEIKRAFELIYRSGLNLTQALEAASAHPWGDEAAHFFAFASESRTRGICALLNHRRNGQPPADPAPGQ